MATKKKSKTAKKKSTKKKGLASKKKRSQARVDREKYAPLIHQYLKKYQADPTSRVFAPLAEAYRKAGMLRDAIEVAREGLRVHPTFSGGKVALARALFESHEYEEVIEVIAPIIHEIPDNLVAQRLLAESHLMVGDLAESLNAFKMLLFFSPNDRETAEIVRELESQRVLRRGLIIPEGEDEPAPRVQREADPAEFSIQPAGEALPEPSKSDASVRLPSIDRATWARRVEVLQGLLQRVERYRHRRDSRAQLD